MDLNMFLIGFKVDTFPRQLPLYKPQRIVFTCVLGLKLTCEDKVTHTPQKGEKLGLTHRVHVVLEAFALAISHAQREKCCIRLRKCLRTNCVSRWRHNWSESEKKQKKPNGWHSNVAKSKRVLQVDKRNTLKESFNLPVGLPTDKNNAQHPWPLFWIRWIRTGGWRTDGCQGRKAAEVNSRPQEKKETAEVDENDKGPLGFQPSPSMGWRGRTRLPVQILTACKDAKLSMSVRVRARRSCDECKAGNWSLCFGEEESKCVTTEVWSCTHESTLSRAHQGHRSSYFWLYPAQRGYGCFRGGGAARGECNFIQPEWGMGWCAVGWDSSSGLIYTTRELHELELIEWRLSKYGQWIWGSECKDIERKK